MLDDNHVFQDGMTALAWAAYKGDKQIVLILLNARANPDIQDQVADCVCACVQVCGVYVIHVSLCRRV